MNVEKAYEALSDWTVARVINHLQHMFGMGTCVIYFQGSPISILELAWRVNSSIPARYIRVKFLGGPNGKRETRDGTLLAVLVDELFLQYSLDNWNTVERFLESASA
jgi:hypothetical protein